MTTMKIQFCYLFTFGMLAFGCAQNRTNIELSAIIDSLYVVDQKVQTDIVDAMKKGVFAEKATELFRIEKETFKRHIPILKKLVEENGYPTSQLVGKERSGKFFFLVQHADTDLEFQEKMMEHIEKEVSTGNVNGRDFAYLTDRIRLAKNESQLYGTQLEYDKGGNAKPRNLFDPKNCDKRRKKYGLEPLEDYLTSATKQYKEMNTKN